MYAHTYNTYIATWRWPAHRALAAALLTVLAALAAACATSDADDAALQDDSVSLALCVSTTRSVTRMTDAATQQNGQPFRSVQDVVAIPFTDEVSSPSLPLAPNVVTAMNRYDNTYYNYLDEHSSNIPYGTRYFLCYCKAKSTGSKFAEGTLSHNLEAAATTGDITFIPEVIHPSVEVPEAAKTIATYLTDMAKNIKIEAGKEELFRKFVNEGHPVAASGTYAHQLAVWARSELPDLTSSVSIDDITYPDATLPDGAAVVRWNSAEEKFVPVTETTTETNINSLNRFVYPAELWYYAISPIRTSQANLKLLYGLSWEEVLNEHDSGDVMKRSIHSIAVTDPLTYAVGCLRLGLTTDATTLADADDTSVSLSDRTFPLTGVFVAGQHPQGYDFTPRTTASEYIVYDKDIPEGISIGNSPSAYNNTLVLQSADRKDIRFALEFENNSGQDFQGVSGIVFRDTKFYLVGTIDLSSQNDTEAPESTDDTDSAWKNRVFTKDHITQGTAKITSLKEAYTYLPDLLDPRLEIGIRLNTTWSLATPTSVPL